MSTSTTGRFRRVIQSPGASVVFAVVLLLCIARVCVSHGNGWSFYTSAFAELFIPRGRTSTGPQVVSFALTGPPWELAPFDEDGGFPQTSPPGKPPLTRIGLFASRTQKGWFEPIYERRWLSISVYHSGTTPLSADAMLSLATYVESSPDLFGYLKIPSDGERSAWIASPQGVALEIVRLLPVAVFINTIAAISAIGLPVSLGWVPARLRRRRWVDRANRGLCPFCAYDRRSTPGQSACPECGRSPVIPE